LTRVEHSLRETDISVEGLFQEEPSLEDYWEQLNQRFGDTGRMILVLNASCILPEGGWARFPRAHFSAGAVCFPLSVRSGLSSIFQSPEHDPGLDPSALDCWLNRFANNALLELPAPSGLSGLLAPSRRDGPLSYQLTDAVFVDDRDLAPMPVSPHIALAYRQAMLERHPLTGLRHAMTEVSKRSENPPADLKPNAPVRLHVSHGWGGGLAAWIEDFVGADTEARSLILRPIGDRSAFGQTLALYDADTPQVPVLSRTFATPIVSTQIQHCEYKQFLEEIVETYGVDAVFVSSLIGHAMEVLDTGLPTIFVLHNFFPTCPAILATFDGPCESCSPARMEDCFANNELQKFFLVESPQHWHAIRTAFAEHLRMQSLRIVAPSASVLARFAQILGNAEPLDGRVIPHGLPAPRANALIDCRRISSTDDATLTVLVLGGQEAHKGGALAAKLVELLLMQGNIQLVLLGFGDSLGSRALPDNVTVIDSYAAKELPGLIRQYAPDVGLLLSTVPETFSYTLSELQAAGIPPIATRLGAFVERIVDGRTGWLVEPTVECVSAQLLAISQNREALDQVRQRVQSSEPRDAGQMVNDYTELLPVTAKFARARPRDAALPSMSQQELFLVDPQARYLDALRAFYRYSLRKASQSPRVPPFLRAWISGR
uniref:glycosyltransferase n=1 Tax=Congregibacter sp. TaxID=2744308 RepID=UPI003F6ADABA